MSMEIDCRIGDAWERGEGAQAGDLDPADQREVLAHFRLLSETQMRRAMDAAVAGAPQC